MGDSGGEADEAGEIVSQLLKQFRDSHARNTTTEYSITEQGQNTHKALEQLQLPTPESISVKLSGEKLLFSGNEIYAAEMYQEFQKWVKFYENEVLVASGKVCIIDIEQYAWKCITMVTATEIQQLVTARGYELTTVPSTPLHYHIFLTSRRSIHSTHLEQVRVFLRTLQRRMEYRVFLCSQDRRNDVIRSALAEVMCMYSNVRVTQDEAELVFWGPRPLPDHAIADLVALLGDDLARAVVDEASARLNRRLVISEVDLNVWLYFERFWLKEKAGGLRGVQFSVEPREGGDNEVCDVQTHGRALRDVDEKVIVQAYLDLYNKVVLATFDRKKYSDTPSLTLALEEIGCMFSNIVIRQMRCEILFIGLKPQPQNALSDFRQLLGISDTVQTKRKILRDSNMQWIDSNIYQDRKASEAKKYWGGQDSFQLDTDMTVICYHFTD